MGPGVAPAELAGVPFDEAEFVKTVVESEGAGEELDAASVLV